VNNSGMIMTITFGPHESGHQKTAAAPQAPRVHFNFAVH
jgi:hypothetical protein